jgi:HK97 family phage major capsid protein
MAYATNTVDLNRGTMVPLSITDDFIAAVEEQSAVMQLAREVQLPGGGLSIPVILGDAVADFVGETHEKPVSNASLEPVQMKPYKLAVIELFSEEFLRDLPALYRELERRLPSAIAKKFDQTVLGGTAPGAGFMTFGAGLTSVTYDATKPYASLAGAYAAAAQQGAAPTGWAVSPALEGAAIVATDQVGRPLFDFANDHRVMGMPSARGTFGTTTPFMGIVGDWSQARWGIVNGINLAVSREATINDGTQQINLWQRNMVALRCEAEVGFVYRAAAFAGLKAE